LKIASLHLSLFAENTSSAAPPVAEQKQWRAITAAIRYRYFWQTFKICAVLLT